MFARLVEQGFELAFQSHARAILEGDFPGLAEELEGALLAFRVPVTELVEGGGGEAKGTQRLRHALHAAGWTKAVFDVERRLRVGQPKSGMAAPPAELLQSQSHEVDHVRTLADGKRIALEIEWNNKDPFFDRDLENFKRLHADGAISVGIIITRGALLHAALPQLVASFLTRQGVQAAEDLHRLGYRPTARQLRLIDARQRRQGAAVAFADAAAEILVSDKFGEATTHWRKLLDRLHRGVGNPCPLLLIGLPAGVVAG